MLSQTSEYALRAALFLAVQEGDGAVKLDRIADALDVPRNYLSKTLHLMARAGVLRSERGPSGGFRLQRAPHEMTLAEVVDPFEPVRLARMCVLGEGECSDATPCAAHERWKLVAEPMREFFGRTTLADVIGGGATVPIMAATI